MDILYTIHMEINNQTILAMVANAIEHPNATMRVDSEEGSLQIKWIPKTEVH